MKLNDYLVPDLELKLSSTLPFESEALDGNNSDTTHAHKGFKPIRITVNLLIKKATPDLLTELTQMAQSVDDKNKRTIYTIVDDLANAQNVSQVQFDDSISVREEQTIDAWRVTFILVEYNSVPEKVESRTSPSGATVENSGASVTGESTTASPEEAQAEVLTGFERMLKRVDNWMAE